MVEEDSFLKSCFLSSFPPRECGIATFTRDLATAMDKRFNPKLKSKIIAVNESENFYNYEKKVIMELGRDDIENYINTAKEINNSENIKIVNIQHEYGLFGGEYGSYIIPLLESITKPVVITFHSVLPNPDERMKKVTQAIAARASAIIVMANSARDILNRDYGIEKEKIHLVHHGIPDVPFQSSEEMKRKLRLENKTVISTFGLLSKGKGIEYVIKSLPSLVEKYPNLVYLIMGETHPVVRREEGEEYRNKLIDLVNELGLKDNVKFYNKYLTLEEIVNYLIASDVYICGNLDYNQITSGTLAYAFGCGRAVISTPIIYAKEMLSNGRGILAEFKNPESFTIAIEKLLSNPELRKNIEREAYTFGRSMIWSNVALNYLEIFNKVVKLRKDITEKFPEVKISHLRNMTDDFGLIQFAKNSVPDKTFGYTLDDNSRALIVSVLHDKLFRKGIPSDLTKIYFNFLKRAQEKDGNFKNNYFNEDEFLNPHSEDSFGRAIWALGYLIRNSKDHGLIRESIRMLHKSLKKIDGFNSPRARAQIIMGLCHYYQTFPIELILQKISESADYLVDVFKKESSENWQWFEQYLTYSNAKLPQSLFFAYEATGNEEYLNIAKKTLDFLSNIVFVDGYLAPIGQCGWYKKNGKRVFFDQQPLEASSMVSLYLTVHKILKEKKYYDKAILSFNWFLGKNHLKQMIYNEVTGGCHDGLGQYSINLNQGAESTVSYLMARLFLEEFKKNNKPEKPSTILNMINPVPESNKLSDHQN